MYTEEGMGAAVLAQVYPSGTFAYLVKKYRAVFSRAHASGNRKAEEIAYEVCLHATIAAIEASKITPLVYGQPSDGQHCMFEFVQILQGTKPEIALPLIAAQRAVTAGNFDYALTVLAKIENLGY